MNPSKIMESNSEKPHGFENDELHEKTSIKYCETKTYTTLDKNNKNICSINNLPIDENKESGNEIFLNRSKSRYFQKLVKKINKRGISFNRRQLNIIIKFILFFIGNMINVFSVFLYMIETYFENFRNEISSRVLSNTKFIEICLSFYFIFEYFLSFTQIKRGGIWRKIFSWESFIDLLTIFPTIIIFFLKIERINFLKVFRIFRVFRILRLYKTLKLLKLESDKNDESEQDHHLKFNPLKVQFFTILIVNGCVFFIAAGLVLAVQELVDNAWSKKDMNFFDAIYFIIVTYTTLGYGDILPLHIISRFLILIGLFVLIVIVSDQFTKMAGLLHVWGSSLERFDKSDHLIVIANKYINLEIFLKEIRERESSVDILILSKDMKHLPITNYPFDKVELMTVLNYDLETLDRANTKNAKAIFIFCFKSVSDCDQEEKINDFLTLKLNRYFNKVPVYLETLYSEGSFSSVIRNSGQKNSSQLISTIPIMRIKSLIISKASYNQGFPTFIQNLMFTNKELTEQSYNFSTLISAYMRGSKNKIYIKKLPKFFNKKMFFDACHMMYFKSINNYFTEINSLDTAYCPIIFLGVLDSSKKYVYNKEEILIFPSRKYIKIDYMDGIFMCNNENELDKVLNSFNLLNDEILNTIRDPKIIKEINILRDLNSRNINVLNRMKNKNLDLNSESSEVVEDLDEEENEMSEEEEEEDVESQDEDKNGIDLKNSSNDNEDDFKLHKKSSFNKNLLSLRKKELLTLNHQRKNSEFDENFDSPKNENRGLINPDLINVGNPVKKPSIEKKLIKVRNTPSVDFKIEINSQTNKNDVYKDITNQNMKLIQQVEETEEFNFLKAFDYLASKRYGILNSLDEDKDLKRIDPGKFVEDRIFNLDKRSVSKFNHIVIIGVQDGMKKLINLFSNHFPSTDICIISNGQTYEENILKLLKIFPSLNYLKGNSGDPQHLLNARIEKCLFCVFLTETIHSISEEDMGKILSYRTIEYFFNTQMILEVWNRRSLRFLGYQPLHKNLDLIYHDFLHPTYMAGRIVLVSELDKIIADKYYDPHVFDVWMSILTLGFASSRTNMGYQTLIKNNQDFPVMLTIDIPQQYVGLEYHNLINDLLLLDNPAICVGLYITNPLEYLTRNSFGRVRKKTRKYTALKITTSYKRKMMNKIILDKVEQSYKNNMNIIRDISYNDQVILDYVDVNKNHLPMFLTNPAPGFVIGENCKCLVFYFYNHNKSMKKMAEFNFKNESNSSHKQFKQSTTIKAEQDKTRLNQSQQVFFSYLDDLKNKARKKYDEWLKKIELDKQSNYYGNN